MSDVAHRFVDASPGNDGLFRHGTELGIANELGAKVAANQLIFRLWVIVWAVIGMGPVISAGGDRLDSLLITKNCNATRSQCPHDFCFGDRLLQRRVDKYLVSDVVAEMNVIKRSGLYDKSTPQQVCFVCTSTQ